MLMRPEGYGNISRQYNFGRRGSSVTRNCFRSSQIRCHLASISRNGYRSLAIIGPEFYILSRQEQEPPRAPSGLASARAGVEGEIPGWGRGTGRTSPAPTLGSYCLIPSSPRASFASVTESACLPSLCSASALSSLDAAFLTLSLLASIFAAASRPCLM